MPAAGSGATDTPIYRYFVDGEWRAAEHDTLLDVCRPYDKASPADRPSTGTR